jgi:hypothetical protein
MKSSLQGLLLGLTSAAIIVVTLGGLAVSLHRDIGDAQMRLLEQTRRLASAAVPVLLNTLVVGDLASAEQTLRRINEDAAWSQVRLYEGDGRHLIIDTSPPPTASLTAPAWFQSLFPFELPGAAPRSWPHRSCTACWSNRLLRTWSTSCGGRPGSR